MDKYIISETVNGVTNYISLNSEAELVKAGLNPMELPGFMTKEQAFKVIGGLRQAAAGTETKYRVKAVSQALRDMITDIILNKLPEAPLVTDEVIAKAVAGWKPEVKAAAEPAPETPAEPVEAETAEEPAEAETKPEKKSKKGKK